FLGEGLTRIKIICILLSMAGVAGVAFGSGETQGRGGWPLLGVACGLVSGLTYASYYIFSKRFLRTYRAPTIFLYIQPFGALFLLPFLGGLPTDAVAWASVLFLGLVTNFGAYTLYCRGLERMEASKASVLATIEPLAAAVLAFAWWGERFSLVGYLGSILIVVSVVVLVRENRRNFPNPY
ncbi:MAG: EamA/RhaT family transporter, partial [Deltaproteobacteria bacterium]|nr:EamA/RhaT family transporter [Deltaproteobacteria bacterium]